MKSIICTFFVFLFTLTEGENCESPKFHVSSYSTRDARLTTESVAQLEITVQCTKGKQPSILFADINGHIVPCAQSSSSSEKFYIGISSVAQKPVPKGRISIKLYDDDGYTALRKARTDDAIKAVKLFGEVELNHQDSSYGLWLPSELLAVIIFGLIWWIAYRERSNILA